MCAGFRSTAGHGELARRFEFNCDWNAFDARHNIARTRSVLTVMGEENGQTAFIRWDRCPTGPRVPRSARA